jgi:hypothetical protein
VLVGSVDTDGVLIVYTSCTNAMSNGFGGNSEYGGDVHGMIDSVCAWNFKSVCKAVPTNFAGIPASCEGDTVS